VTKLKSTACLLTDDFDDERVSYAGAFIGHNASVVAAIEQIHLVHAYEEPRIVPRYLSHMQTQRQIMTIWYHACSGFVARGQKTLLPLSTFKSFENFFQSTKSGAVNPRF